LAPAAHWDTMSGMDAAASGNIKDRIRAALAAPLPGREAQERMAPADRRGQAVPRGSLPSAVLLAIVAGNRGPSLILIERAAGGVHGGQIAFPGGKREAGDASLAETALREAREEIGLDPASVEVLGLLSPLAITVSRFLVQPVVGFVAEEPALRPNPGEVASIIEVPLAELLRPESRQERAIPVGGDSLLVPCYAFGEALVWGATAMILSEFEAALATLRPR
jgi:8-oxo-dGTP pyrophosphatase MutT (NUDIX family)